jgi:hypothetical protein
VALAAGLFVVALGLALVLRRTRSLLDRPTAGGAVPAS